MTRRSPGSSRRSPICYVDDAFAAAHRAHASIEAVTRFLRPAVAGLLMKRELEALARIFDAPRRPVIAVLGGAKVSDKLALVEHLLDRVDGLVIGGGMAFTFLAALGHAVGRSLLEPDRVPSGARPRSPARDSAASPWACRSTWWRRARRTARKASAR